MRRLLTYALTWVIALWPSLGLTQTATPVPNAQQQFFNSSGVPLTGGTVTMYVPNTTTLKTIWLDQNQATQAANPYTLATGGYATIFGQGNYRQIVKDASNNLIWDSFTTAVGSSTPVGGGSSDTAPVGTVMAWAGFSVPTNWQLAYGQALNRTTYAQLFTAITIAQSGSCTNGSNTISGLTDTSQMAVGEPIEATCIPSGTTIATVASSTSLTVTCGSPPCGNASVAATFTIFPWGNGDGVLTFNAPDMRGRIAAGVDAMGGTSANRLTSAVYGAKAQAGISGGGQSQTIAQANLPSLTWPSTLGVAQSVGTKVYTDALTSADFNQQSNTNISGGTFVRLASAPSSNNANLATLSLSGSITSGGTGTALPVIQPTIAINYIVKVAPNSSGAGGVVTMQGLTGDVTETQVFDSICGVATQGAVLYRGASAVSCLSPGSNGQLLATQGASANPHWITASGTGTVTSVAMTVPSFFSVSGSPITAAGTLAVTANAQGANAVLAGPTPSFRALTVADTPWLASTSTNGALVRFSGTTGGTQNGTITEDGSGNLSAIASANFSAGTTSIAPIDLAAGTNLTTALAGAFEYDGSAGYFTPSASNRGLFTSDHEIITETSGFTLTNTNAAQKAFGTPTNGAITLPASTGYDFDLVYSLTNTGTTSHTWAVLFGGTATITDGSMVCQAETATSTALTAVSQAYTSTLASAFVVTAASVSATENVNIVCRGHVDINAGGTWIPQVQASAAPGGTQTMLAHSYYRMHSTGPAQITSVGNWS